MSRLWDKMQTQTKIATLGYVMVVLAHFVVLAALLKRPKMGLNYAMFLITIPLSIYVINCTVVGKCELYASIYSYLVLFWGLLLMLSALFFLLSSK